MLKKFRNLVAALFLLVVFVSNSFAIGLGTSGPLFDAVDISGISTNVSTLVIGFIGISLIGVGAYYVFAIMRSRGKRF